MAPGETRTPIIRSSATSGSRFKSTKCLKNGTVVDQSDRTRHADNDPVLLHRFLRPRRLCGGSEQQPCREIAPSHSISWSARASIDAGMVRFSKQAVFRLM